MTYLTDRQLLEQIARDTQMTRRGLAFAFLMAALIILALLAEGRL